MEARRELEAVFLGEGFEPGLFFRVGLLIDGLGHEPDLIVSYFRQSFQIIVNFLDIGRVINDEFELSFGSGEHVADHLQVGSGQFVARPPFEGTLFRRRGV